MKKLLNKKGSVLFLVVVVMSLLIIAASATYYVVSSQRSSVEVHYASEQSYQTALSVSETVEGYLAAVLKQVSKGDIDYKNTIFKKMMDMSPTDTLVASKDLREYGLGGFDIEIKKDPALSTEDESVFNITTKSEVNGETTTLTQVWKVKLTEEETKYFTRFLTSTGMGTGEDTALLVNNIYGDNYFENEFTTFKDDTKLHRSIYSTGTIISQGMIYDSIDMKDEEVVIAGNYYIDPQPKNIEVNRILVGGNMEFNQGGNQVINTKAVYVMGDLTIKAPLNVNDVTFFVQGDCHIENANIDGKCKFYVENDLYWQGGNWNANNGEMHVNHDIHFTGGNMNGLKELSYGNKMYDGSGNEVTKISNMDGSNVTVDIGSEMQNIDGLDDDPANGDFDSWIDVQNYISNSTAVGTYQVWDALHFFEGATEERPDVGKFFDSPTFDIAAEISANHTEMSDCSENEYECKQINTIEQDGEGALVTIKESCRYRMPTYAPKSRFALIIDASDEDIYVYLDPNGQDTFQFYPDGASLNVLIKGTHSVIFVLPENKTFRMAKNCFIGHYELAKKIAGSELSSKNEIWNCYLNNGNGDQMRDLLADKTKYVLKTITEEDGTESTFLNDEEFGGNPVHNNIFLVSRGNNQFDFAEVCTLAGYIYAPSTTLDISASGNHMKFFGGLIVGGFRYDHKEGLLAFCSPYDPYNGDGANVVSNLISQASNGVYGSPGSKDGEKQLNSVQLGYR